MGSSGAETPTKASKSSVAQEQPPVPPATGAAVYPEWGGFQAYSPMPPHGFFPSPMASSPQAHPYVWGQHMMPPYGTPPHPYLMYPHGGIYAHPSMHPGAHPFSPYPMPPPNSNAEAPDAAPGGEELEGKSSNGKGKSPLKATKGSLGSLNMITGKSNNELGKTSGASNGAASHSVESGSDDSSEGSDANSQKDSQAKTGNTHCSSEAEVTPNGSGGDHDSQNGVTHMPPQAIPNHGITIIPMQVTGAPAGVSGPTTNLNIGMDYWGAAAPPPIVPMRGKVSNPQVVPGLGPSGIGAGRENIPSDLWLQDERELKRQRRKQSNRESARRSRLRKQAECEELGHRVEVLKEENSTLISELNRYRNEYQQLLSENTSLKERLDEVPKDNATRLDMSNLHSGEREMNLDSDVQEGLADNVPSSS